MPRRLQHVNNIDKVENAVQCDGNDQTCPQVKEFAGSKVKS